MENETIEETEQKEIIDPEQSEKNEDSTTEDKHDSLDEDVKEARITVSSQPGEDELEKLEISVHDEVETLVQSTTILESITLRSNESEQLVIPQEKIVEIDDNKSIGFEEQSVENSNKEEETPGTASKFTIRFNISSDTDTSRSMDTNSQYPASDSSDIKQESRFEEKKRSLHEAAEKKKKERSRSSSLDEIDLSSDTPTKIHLQFDEDSKPGRFSVSKTTKYSELETDYSDKGNIIEEGSKGLGYSNDIRYEEEEKYGDGSTSLSFTSSSETIKRTGSSTSFEKGPYDNTIPFTLQSSFGINVKAKFQNLTTSADYNWMFYAASHAGVLHNYKTMKQKFLLGHKNEIENISCDVDGKWLVTADKGKDSTVIIWNEECVPVSTIFDAHGSYSVEKLCLSFDAKYLVTVGNEPKPIIKLWLWTYGSEKADAEYEVHTNSGPVIEVSNNMNKTEHFMVTFQNQVIYNEWDEENKKFVVHFPKLKYKKNIGKFTASTYLLKSSVCATSTDTGWAILWGNKEYKKILEHAKNYNDKIFLKAIKLQSTTITVMTSVNRLFVTGDVQGHIKFYDRKMRILYWITKLNFAPIVTLGFHRYMRKYCYADVDTFSQITVIKKRFATPMYEDRSNEYNKLIEDYIPADATLARTPFIIRDFLVLTKDGQLIYIYSLTQRYEIILKRMESYVTAIDTYRESPKLCLGFANGKLLVYNYLEKTWVLEKYLVSKPDEESMVTAIQFAYKDTHMTVGTASGAFWFLHPTVLDPLTEVPFRMEPEPILGIRYSTQNELCAFWDASMAVCLFYFNIFEKTGWELVKRIRAHYKAIADLVFISSEGNNRLISVGEDRCLVEYDVSDCEHGELRVKKIVSIEQTAIPNCFIYYKLNNESKFLVAENKFKFKILADETFKVEKTILGPTFDTPIRKIQLISRNPMHEVDHMLFATETYVGIHAMPPSGNPFKYVGMITHPKEIINFALSYDCEHVLTIGKEDSCCLMWKIRKEAVETMYNRGGKELTPYYTLIEGGVSGWLVREMQDLFYYMQILNQGENSPDSRRITNKIELTELPSLIRAIGFYPTEYELENLMKEAEFGHYNERTQVYEITFEEFVKYYINHRPAFGVSTENIKKAFYTLTNAEGDINKNDFINLLCQQGEPFTLDKLKQCIPILMQHSEGSGETFDTMPEVLSVENLLYDMLGIDMNKRIQVDSKIDQTE